MASEELAVKLAIMRQMMDESPSIIASSWQQLAALAWKGYLEQGRGAVLFDLQAAQNAVTHPGVIVQCNYLRIDPNRVRETLCGVQHVDISDETDPFEETLLGIERFIRDYDPKREIVLFISSDDDCWRPSCLHSESEDLLDPVDAYDAERNIHRNDSFLN